ncbi:MAG TPA: Rap1a/Tai family immunity protein, partial [Gammaproteobacteria bacterium]|nr:Rap1a/Tai family immunity protein [Gammaproteobacteria bacterium]
FCLGYVFAIAEALYAVPDKTVCFEGVSPETLLDAVVSHVANQPAPREQQAGTLVAIALETSFPCK